MASAAAASTAGGCLSPSVDEQAANRANMRRAIIPLATLHSKAATPCGLNATSCGPNAAPFRLDGMATSSCENGSDHVAGVVHNLDGTAVRVVRKIDDPPASGGHAGRSRKGLGERIGG